jgi:hypothetical protein
MTISRRNFIAGSAGLAGTLLPAFARGQAKPCPPPGLSMAGGGSVATPCNSTSPGSAPQWFVEMPERTWFKIANGAKSSADPWLRGKAFSEVIPGHAGDHIGALPRGNAVNNEGPSAVFDDWTGACVDQPRRQLILAANGGHSGYPGNEVYLLRLDQAAPGYERLCDPTPRYNPNNPSQEWWRSDQLTEQSGALPAWNNDFEAPATYGRMRAVHGWNRVAYGDGKVWYAAQDSYVSAAGGGHSPSVWSFDRNWVDANGEFPLRHRVSQNPWKLHSPSATSHSVDWRILNKGGGYASDRGFWYAHPSVYDPLSRRVYSFTRDRDAQGNAACWYVNTITGQVATFTARIPWVSYTSAWGACATDVIPGQSLFYFPYMEDPQGRIQAWNLTSNSVHTITPTNAATTLWTDPAYNPRNPTESPVDSPVHPGGHGAVFHAQSRSILVYSVGAQVPEPRKAGLGTTIRRLRIPSDPINGTYRWEDVVAQPGSATPTYSLNGCNSKFNIVNDMGNGQACLVLASNVDGAFVYKLPNGDT